MMKSNDLGEIGRYKILFRIGKGVFSTIYQGSNIDTGEPVALKIVERKRLNNIKIMCMFEREIRIMNKLDNENLVKLYDTIYTPQYIVIVMENLRGGTLTLVRESAIAQIPEETILRWGKEILEGLSYLHSRQISHHDIKPDNIGFDDDMQANIFDFGLCEECLMGQSIEKCRDKSGTPFFFAPEMLLNTTYDGRKSDVWSFGVTFHYLATGKLPFISISYDEFLSKCSDIQKILKNSCTGAIKPIVDAALTVDPKLRPTADELLKMKEFEKADICFKHPIHSAMRSNKTVTKSPVKFVVRNSRRSIIVPPNYIATSATENSALKRICPCTPRYSGKF